MKQVLGNTLTQTEQTKALARFVHRFTRSHVPSWSRKPWMDDKAYPVQFASDSDWLANTRFWICNDGKLSERNRYCESTPTWPDNPELRKELA